MKPGVRFREIGEVINRHASMSGFSVVMCNFVFAFVSYLHFVEDDKQYLVILFSLFC